MGARKLLLEQSEFIGVTAWHLECRWQARRTGRFQRGRRGSDETGVKESQMKCGMGGREAAPSILVEKVWHPVTDAVDSGVVWPVRRRDGGVASVPGCHRSAS